MAAKMTKEKAWKDIEALFDELDQEAAKMTDTPTLTGTPPSHFRQYESCYYCKHSRLTVHPEYRYIEIGTCTLHNFKIGEWDVDAIGVMTESSCNDYEE